MSDFYISRENENSMENILYECIEEFIQSDFQIDKWSYVKK